MKRTVSFTGLWLMAAAAQAQSDTVPTLQEVTVTALQKASAFTAITPAQQLDRKTLFRLNAPTVGDAARYFSGVQVKDYGGVGGLKTVSVRSLGASHTGVFYDGLPVSDVQTGQTDLSRFSSTFLQTLQLQQGGPEELLQPARATAAAALLSIRTTAFYPAVPAKTLWQAGMRTGSFGLWQPSAGVAVPLSKRVALTAFGEAVFSRGDYPFRIVNGNQSGDSRRNNSEVRSAQGEVNLSALLKDSASLQAKVWLSAADRGLPGSITFFNDRSVQTLRNQDAFAQLRYAKKLTGRTALLLAAKHQYSFTRYRDPDFLNGAGGLDNRYTQQETYGSAAVKHLFTPALQASLASDIAYNRLEANLNNFAFPKRLTLWNAASLSYARPRIHGYANLLLNSIWDKTATGPAASPTQKWLPTVALSLKPAGESPWMLRLFYKQVFRMPTFNDLYYNFFGNSKLRPELAHQYNAGLVYSKRFQGGKLNTFSLSADAYYNRVRDKIVAIPSQNLFVWTMLNLGEVSIKGLDVSGEAGGQLSTQWSWSSRLAYTYQQAIDVTDPATTTYRHRIPYTPDHSGSAFGSLSYRQWTLGYSFLFAGTRYALGENNPANQLAGWGVHDLFVSRSFRLGKINAWLKAEADNLSAERYEVVRFYPMPGRAYKISLLFNNQ